MPVERGRHPLARAAIQHIDAVRDLLPQVEEIGLNAVVMRNTPEAGADGREDALVHWCRQRGLNAEPLYLQGREEDSTE